VNFDLVSRPELELPGEFCRVELADAGKVYDALFQFRPEGICHLAANPAPSGQAQIDVFDNNVLSAHNLMQAAGDLGVPRVVYASSEMATGLLTEGTAPTQIPFDETEWHPSPNAYALSKHISEVIADSVAVRYPQTAWVGLRINNVIAPDGYDRSRTSGKTLASARQTSGATSTPATSALPTARRWKGRAAATRCA
jgi:nucleoside-diphosphate-sugar epimerase